MAPALLPQQILQEMEACALLGASLGAVRGILPKRGRAAFLPDLVYVGVLLLALQSYAAGCSVDGVLRWYMIGSAAASAAAVGTLLALPGRFLRLHRKKSLKKIQKELAK